MAHNRKISVVGLGYVGLPVAVAFGQHSEVIGYDKNAARIAELQKHHDRTNEVSTAELKDTSVTFTTDSANLSRADFHIVAVPTPLDKANQPDLSILLAASANVGKQLKKGDIVVYESTVYPGVTEEECVPVLEQTSSLKCGVDFTVGYSPERINPGDEEHRFTQITKIVSGQDEQTLEIVAQVYGSVVEAGVHRASSIKVAEAAKVIENTQRDINVALMNELAIIFSRMDVDTHEVLQAANTKWNFLPFKPGLVGGHCIGVDPYYLTYKAQQLDYHPDVILAGRRINDNMGKFIAEQTILEMSRHNIAANTVKVGIMGITFKENCPDIRNTRVMYIIKRLREFGIEPIVYDPVADVDEVKQELGLTLHNWDEFVNVNVLITPVAHQVFCELPNQDILNRIIKPGLVMDVKAILDQEHFTEQGVKVWRL